MWFQLVYLYCAVGAGAPNCTLASAKAIETTPAVLTEAECRAQLASIPREATVENDPRSGLATVACARREDIRREAQKSEAELMKHMAPPAESPAAPSHTQMAG